MATHHIPQIPSPTHGPSSHLSISLSNPCPLLKHSNSISNPWPLLTSLQFHLQPMATPHMTPIPSPTHGHSSHPSNSISNPWPLLTSLHFPLQPMPTPQTLQFHLQPMATPHITPIPSPTHGHSSHDSNSISNPWPLITSLKFHLQPMAPPHISPFPSPTHAHSSNTPIPSPTHGHSSHHSNSISNPWPLLT